MRRVAATVALLGLFGCDVDSLEQEIGTARGCPTRWEPTSSNSFQTDVGTVSFPRLQVGIQHGITGRNNGCLVNIGMAWEDETGDLECSLRLWVRQNEPDLDGVYVVDDALFLGSPRGCNGIPRNLRGSYIPGPDFRATLDLDADLNDPDAALACATGQLKLNIEGSMVRREESLLPQRALARSFTFTPKTIILDGDFQSEAISTTCIGPRVGR